MFQTICETIPDDAAFPARCRRIETYKRVLDGTIYDGLLYEFHDERNGAGEYVPLRCRRPSVRYGLCRTVVEDAVSLLFGDSHFPTVETGDAAADAVLADLIGEARLKETMIEAAIQGSVGSAAVLMRVLRGRVFFSVLDTQHLTPEWNPEAPDELLRVTERYKARGAALAEQGYEGLDPGVAYWFQRVWDAEGESWYRPWPVAGSGDAGAVPEVDAARSIEHRLGFVPIVWIRNLPGGDGIDGACTFKGAIETGIEIDYQLSQAGRGLKYSSDPTLLIKEPATADREIVKGAGNALVVSEKGDAKLLEIGGTAAEAVISYVRLLRELALESVHGNRASAERLGAPQSGRALELMNQGLICLSDNLRISYGEGGILPLVRLVMRASNRFALRVLGRDAAPFEMGLRLQLRWPRWYPLSADDRLKEAQAVAILARGGVMSREAAIRGAMPVTGVTDAGAELDIIERDGS